MSFQWNTILGADESILKEFSISKTYQKIILLTVIISSIIIFFMVLYIGIFVLCVGGIYWLYLNKAKHYTFTNKRVILVDSFIGKNIISVDYHQITDVIVEQSATEQILGWGSIIIDSTNPKTPKIILAFIDHPQKMKEELDRIRGGKIYSF